MIQVHQIRRGLREDAILSAVLGTDSDDEVKVYWALAKQNVEAPFVVCSVAPSIGPDGTYGDPFAWENFRVQATAWGRSSLEAWQLAGFVEEAMMITPFDFSPLSLARVARDGTPQELPDRDTSWRQVLAFYQFQVGR